MRCYGLPTPKNMVRTNIFFVLLRMCSCAATCNERSATQMFPSYFTNRLNDVKKTESNCILRVTRGAQIRNSLSRSCIAAFYGLVRCV